MTSSDNIRRLRELGRRLVDPEIAASIIENLPDAIIVVDEAGHIQLVNHQAELLFGYDRDSMYDQSVEMLVPMDRREAHVYYRLGFIQEPRVRPMGHSNIPLKGRRRDGSEFLAEINLSPLMTTEGLLVMAVIRRRRDETEARHTAGAA